MPTDQYLTPCRIYFDRKGKNGQRYILFSIPTGDAFTHALYDILGKDEVQDNYEGCEVMFLEEGKDSHDLNMPITDFKK